MKRAWMDRFIDTIEWIAAAFVGIVALNIFVAVILRNTMNYAIPDSFDIGRMLLGILIFWGIAATSYRGGGPTPALPRKRERERTVFYCASALYLVSEAFNSAIAASGSTPFFLTPSAQVLTSGSEAFFHCAVCSGVSV